MSATERSDSYEWHEWHEWHEEDDGAGEMAHERAEELLRREFEDGDLPGQEARELRRHLRQCPGCRDERFQMAKLEDLFRGRRRPASRMRRPRVIAGPVQVRAHEGNDARLPGKEERKAA